MDLSGLNEAQREAVLADEHPLLVLAGAGTGKTTVIAHRLAHFLRVRNVEPRQVLAVTFTNKAAREMRDRSARLAGQDPRFLDIGTFHGICGRLLRRYGERLGLSSRYVIYDQDDQLRLVRRCAADLNLDPQRFAPRNIRSRIENWKNQGLGPDKADVQEFDLLGTRARDVYRLYEKRCREANAVDFGDMLLHTLTLLRDDSEIRLTLRARWTHVLVDEYQDTNPVQYQLLRELVTEHHSLTVVGDDDQSIYRWRGADIRNILRFERDFPGAQLVRLERNYRSTETILSAANAVIAHNASRKGKTLYTDGNRGNMVRLRLFGTERDEGEAVAAEVSRFIDEGRQPGEIAALYRTNAQSRPLEDALRRRRIPYAIYGGVRFYDRREVKDALAYLRLISNPRSEIDFLRIINAPARGIGKTTLERLTSLAGAEGISLFEAAGRAADGAGKVASRIRGKLRDFVRFVDNFREEASQADPGRLLAELLEESGYLDALRNEGTEEAQDRLENLNELVAAIDEYSELSDEPTLEGFLEEVALATDIDDLSIEGGQVNLMTLHSAKGLEFDVVFMPGMEEGLFPHSRSVGERPALEEERRLCYVGLTRAKRELMLSAARVRTVFGEPRYSELSRFVVEIPSELMTLGAAEEEVEDSDPFDQRPTSAEELPAIRRDDEITDDPFAPGRRVFHRTFGEGQIVSSDGAGKKQKLTIEFPSVGRKTIVARFVEPR